MWKCPHSSLTLGRPTFHFAGKCWWSKKYWNSPWDLYNIIMAYHRVIIIDKFICVCGVPHAHVPLHCIVTIQSSVIKSLIRESCHVRYHISCCCCYMPAKASSTLANYSRRSRSPFIGNYSRRRFRRLVDYSRQCGPSLKSYRCCFAARMHVSDSLACAFWIY